MRWRNSQRPCDDFSDSSSHPYAEDGARIGPGGEVQRLSRYVITRMGCHLMASYPRLSSVRAEAASLKVATWPRAALVAVTDSQSQPAILLTSWIPETRLCLIGSYCKLMVDPGVTSLLYTNDWGCQTLCHEKIILFNIG